MLSRRRSWPGRSGTQAATAITAADYARAEKFLAPATTPLVFGLTVQPTWLPDGKFWYRATSATGPRQCSSILPASGASSALRTTPSAVPLRFRRRRKAGRPGGRGRAGGAPGGRAGGPGAAGLSPDGKRTAFIRDFNLWVRDVATSQEVQLTTDGVKDFGYATNNAGWTKSDAPVLAWSPDSKRIATFQHDGRGVSEMYLVSTNVGAPTLQAWKYPLPGDAKIFMIERVVIDVDTKKLTRLLMPPDPHRSSLCDHVVCGGTGPMCSGAQTAVRSRFSRPPATIKRNGFVSPTQERARCVRS